MRGADSGWPDGGSPVAVRRRLRVLSIVYVWDDISTAAIYSRYDQHAAFGSDATAYQYHVNANIARQVTLLLSVRRVRRMQHACWPLIYPNATNPNNA